ncbi:MAG: hypothetical protein Q8S73_12625 [Deltaproteobacteria bacterium]|nr:hypothetical protein [Myxococcales bacterium]MDP3214944.1 hypothetical protein [Deltaproteobacteria bacterium]
MKTATANDNSASTPALDVVLSALRGQHTGELGWALIAWADHLRATSHPNHAANSYAKHRAEFDRLADAASLLTVARCLDFGLSPTEASALVTARVAARVRKVAA